MIGLNKIGLNQVQLNRLYLNAPFPVYRKMAGGGSSGDGFPVLPGDVTRWHFGGLTNEMMAAMDDPRIEDADHKGRFLSFKNFLWAGMSGVGGYTQNFNQYIGLSIFDKTVKDSSVKVFIPQNNNSTSFYDSKLREIGYTYNFHIKVTGIENRELRVINGTEGDIILSIKQDGIYLINTIVSDDWGQNRLYFVFPKANSNNTVTIEQLPLYPGALVFDGVDDYGICENFPILTKEKGYTVVALRQFLGSRDSFLISNRVTGTAFSNGAFIFERFWEESGAIFYNFGTPSDQLSLKPYSPFSYLTSKSYNGRATNAGDAVPSNTLLVGKSIINDSNPTNAAIWEICILDHDATEEELQKIQDYYKQEYPWLFPDQAWTVVGKTNEDTDRATITNITGNGNNLVLSNFGFAENSGYGLYQLNFSQWTVPSVSVSPIINSSSVVFPSGLVASSLVLYYPDYGKQTLNVTLKVTGAIDGLIFKRRNIKDDGTIYEVYTQLVEGINKLEYDDIAVGDNWTIAIGFRNAIIGNVLENDIQIEQIPEYEGYLVTDGVDDRIVSAEPITFAEKWTVVTDTIFLEAKVVSAGILVQKIFSINNYLEYGRIEANVWNGALSKIPTSSIKAISSDGKIYDTDWNEYQAEPGTIEISNGYLVIATSHTRIQYCQIAFKDLAIYPTVLSKEDCIKAYNYLQTLKAK